MGACNCCSASTSSKQIEEFENKLYAVCMKIDFDVGPNQIISFKEKFRSENTNELGQVLNEESAEIIIQEFRKFLFLCGIKIAEIRRKSKDIYSLKPIGYFDGQKSLSIECPYAAPPYIDRVWRSLIAYDQKYKEICYKICQGYMRRTEPRNNYCDQFEKYEQCREELIKRKDKLHPFNAIWPEYKKEHEFSGDFDYTVCVSKTHLQGFIDFLGKAPAETGHINAEYCVSFSKKMSEDYQREFPEELQGRPSYNSKALHYSSKENQVWSNQKEDDKVKESLEKVMNFAFPRCFVDHISTELMI